MGDERKWSRLELLLIGTALAVGSGAGAILGLRAAAYWVMG